MKLICPKFRWNLPLISDINCNPIGAIVSPAAKNKENSTFFIRTNIFPIIKLQSWNFWCIAPLPPHRNIWISWTKSAKLEQLVSFSWKYKHWSRLLVITSTLPAAFYWIIHAFDLSKFHSLGKTALPSLPCPFPLIFSKIFVNEANKIFFAIVQKFKLSLLCKIREWEYAIKDP